jgi:hypothetical protein
VPVTTASMLLTGAGPDVGAVTAVGESAAAGVLIERDPPAARLPVEQELPVQLVFVLQRNPCGGGQGPITLQMTAPTVLSGVAVGFPPAGEHLVAPSPIPLSVVPAAGGGPGTPTGPGPTPTPLRAGGPPVRPDVLLGFPVTLGPAASGT